MFIHYGHAANMAEQLYCICAYVSIIHFRHRFDPYSKSGFAICRICKSSVHQAGSHYCQGCAYKKGTKSHCTAYYCMCPYWFIRCLVPHHLRYVFLQSMERKKENKQKKKQTPHTFSANFSGRFHTWCHSKNILSFSQFEFKNNYSYL